MNTNMHFLSYLVQFLEWEMFQKKNVEKIKTFYAPLKVLEKSCRLLDNVENHCRAG
jgi:hypothetical protein